MRYMYFPFIISSKMMHRALVVSNLPCMKAPLRKISSALPRLGPQICVVGAGPAGFYVSQHLSKVNINFVQRAVFIPILDI